MSGIKGITHLPPKATKLGSLHKGDVKGENKPGPDLKHFRVVFEPQFEQLLGMWTEMFGDEPTEFTPVLLTANTTDEAFVTAKEEWNASMLIHRCDGEFLSQSWNESTQSYIRAKLPCLNPIDPATGEGKHPGACSCKNSGRLDIFLPEFCNAVGIIGYFTVTTSSIADIMTVDSYLRFVENSQGGLMGVPFVFGRAPDKISVPKTKKVKGEYVKDGRMRVEKSLFYLHIAPEFVTRVALPNLTQYSLPAPSVIAENDIPAETTRELLNSGGETGERRMGDAPPAPVQTRYSPKLLIDQTSGLFNDPAEQHTFIIELARKGVLNAEMSDEQAIDAVKSSLAFAQLTWAQDAKTLKNFLAKAQKDLGLSLGDVKTALDTATGKTHEGIADFTGTKTTAWAACIAFKAKYSLELLPPLGDDLAEEIGRILDFVNDGIPN